MTDRWRCFVAAPIDDPLRSSLVAARAAWVERPDLAGLRWTDPSRWHVTLAFLGDVDRDHVPTIVDRVASVAQGHRPLSLPTGGVGAFPDASTARVAWYGIGDPDGQLTDLAVDVARSSGVSVEADYRPHLTLARARAQPVDLRAWIREAGSTTVATLAVSSLEIMRSHPGRGQAAYETLAVLPLGGPPT